LLERLGQIERFDHKALLVQAVQNVQAVQLNSQRKHMRVVHYLNQFFGGLGGEDKAGAPLEVREGAVGPGLLLEQLLGNDAKIVMTLVCGDNLCRREAGGDD
jgi:hypothetical protein